MKRGMPSGAQTPDGIIFLLALIFSKAPPRYPPHHGAHWAYTKAEAPLKMIQALYRIEREAKARAEKKGTDTALFHARKEARRQSQKLVREFFEQCRVLKESERPSSPVAQAVSYALNIEEELKKFLKDARLNIDNNPAERLNRYNEREPIDQ